MLIRQWCPIIFYHHKAPASLHVVPTYKIDLWVVVIGAQMLNILEKARIQIVAMQNTKQLRDLVLTFLSDSFTNFSCSVKESNLFIGVKLWIILVRVILLNVHGRTSELWIIKIFQIHLVGEIQLCNCAWVSSNLAALVLARGLSQKYFNTIYGQQHHALTGADHRFSCLLKNVNVHVSDDAWP